MKLEDLRPKEVDFEVSGLKLTFRPFTIADDLKAQDICGGQDKMMEVFDKYDFEKISLMAWYQLTFDSQKEVLKAVEGVYIDPETGEETKVNLKPIEKFRKLFVGLGDEISLVTNLIRCKGINIPNLDDEEALGKWIDQLSQAFPSIGQ